MTRESADKIAVALETLARVIRESVAEPQPSRRVKLSEAEKVTGIPASTLTKLIQQRQIAAARVGVGRGHYLVDVADVEKYLKRRTEPARVPLLREVRA